MNYYTSDLHLGHINILSSRPQFSCLEEMEQTIISNWNSKVSATDTVYIIGDLSYRAEKHISYYLKRLNGVKHLVIGNHDYRWLKNVVDTRKYFMSIQPMIYFIENNIHITLCHYPMLEWEASHYNNSYLIHGHIHASKTNTYYIIQKYLPNALNAGVDINNYQPVSFEELVNNNRKWYHNE